MSVTRRQQAKFSAALCLIHDSGHDAAAVQREAKAIIAIGTPANQALDRALAKFVARVPSAAAPLQRIGRLIDAADERAVASYNVALASYLDTGDDSDLRSIAPVIARDMIAQAARDGDTPPEFSEEMDSMIAGTAAPSDGGGEALPADAGEAATQ